MSHAIDQAIQHSVARAMLWAVFSVLLLSLLAYALAGEWQRLERTAIFGLFIVPLGLYSAYLLRLGKSGTVLRIMLLACWLGLSVMLFTAGTLANPVPLVLLAVAVTGLMAQERLLSWLLPVLTLLTLCSVGLLAKHGLLPGKLPPSELGLLIGSLTAIAYLVVLTLISNHHLQQVRRSEREQGEHLQQISAELELAIEAGGIACFRLDTQDMLVEVATDRSQLFAEIQAPCPLAEVELFSVEDRQRIAAAATQALSQGSFAGLVCQLQSGPGRERWYRLYAARSQSSGTQLICALQDIHEQRQTELAKNNFTAMVSHELRTPLTAVLGSLQLLQGLHGQQLSNDARDLLQMALRGGERMTALVNDFLDYFRLQAGRLTMNCRLQALQPMLQSASDAVQSLLQARGQQLQLGDVQAAPVWMDRQRAEQVLINLLSNAIKFSPEGGRIELFVQAHGEFLRVSLRDHGPGIDAEFSKRIFEPFSQACAGNTRISNSSGLGLAISRQLMRQMGGELSYSSVAGAGATFHMDFPRREPVSLPPREREWEPEA